MKHPKLTVDIVSGPVEKWQEEAIAIAVYSPGRPQKALEQCGEKIVKSVHRRLEEGWMSGAVGESLLLPAPEGSKGPVKKILLVGMGPEKKVDQEGLRALGARLVTICSKQNLSALQCLISLDKHNGIKRGKALESLAEGAWLGHYQFDRFQSQEEDSEEKKKDRTPTAIALGFGVGKEPTLPDGKRLEKVEALCRGVNLARDLGNLPGNHLNPATLADEALKLAADHPIEAIVWEEETLIKKGMNGILAVGQGSQTKPRLITLNYRQGGDKPLLAVVGKAVTFDAGGISLKPAAKMDEMKFDMSGGAAVLGFLRAIAEMQLPINVVGIIPTAENLPSHTAQRPGDVIKTAKGIFVEVANTDAEGRLILADALYHAESFEPKVIIDLATLTGACVIALGAHASGLMGNSKKLLNDLQQSGDACGDRVWPLPLFEAYQSQIKSTVADIKNVGTPGAGTITAGCFLSRFVEKNRQWAHIDIAGTAWDMASTKPHAPKGATGVGVRLLCHYAEKHFT